MYARDKWKSMKNKDLEELTEVKFELGLVKVIREFRAQINNAVNMINDIDYYKSKGYEIKYYFNKKERIYTFYAYEREVGFKPYKEEEWYGD